MNAPSSETVSPGRSHHQSAEELASTLAAEMIECWRNGERPLPEDFLDRQPELWDHPEAAAELIYEELCLRQEYGPAIPASQVLDRFPQWRRQLELLLDCQSLLGPRAAALTFPATGESVNDFLLLYELGRGAQGRVYLAAQRSLSDRRVVLKLVAPHAGEHLLLARLQHTHIVPLYSVEEDAVRGLRALCMPYFGGATLAQLFERLRSTVPSRRSGRDLLTILDQVSSEHGEEPAGERLRETNVLRHGHPAASRAFLTRGSYLNAVCWIGACLADALQYAHERGLLHLDLKPSNVLLAADGQPMLLDFHLAREPIDPSAGAIACLGGTTGYMSPEQAAGVQAVLLGKPVEQPVDARADIYSLGVVLYEALAGALPPPTSHAQALLQANEHVSPGLAEIISRCLARDLEERYCDMNALAADLRRHLAHLPLVGVRNRSLAERWRKWRRRSPQSIARGLMALTVILAIAAVVLGLGSVLLQKSEDVQASLDEARSQEANGNWEAAIRNLQRADNLAGSLPFRNELAHEVSGELQRLRKGQIESRRQASIRALHELANRVRFLPATTGLSAAELRQLENSCHDLWKKRGEIETRLTAQDARFESSVRDDLLDIVLFWTDLRVQATPAGRQVFVRSEALENLAEAAKLFGPSPVLEEASRQLGNTVVGSATPAHSAWEHAALARLFLRRNLVERAAGEARQAMALDPQGLWSNFYLGLCEFRQGQFADATVAFSVCIGAAPEAATFYNRGRSYAALNNQERALADYDEALRRAPKLGAAMVNRGLLFIQAGRFGAAKRDLQQACALGEHAQIPLALLYLLEIRHAPSIASAWDSVRELSRAFGIRST